LFCSAPLFGGLHDILNVINMTMTTLHVAALFTHAQERIAPKAFGWTSLSNCVCFHFISKLATFIVWCSKGPLHSFQGSAREKMDKTTFQHKG